MEFAKNKKFQKQFLKLPVKAKVEFANKLDLLLNSPKDSRLNNHKLNGEYKNHRSINITGDIRAIYIMADKETYYFIAIGTHSELYE